MLHLNYTEGVIWNITHKYIHTMEAMLESNKIDKTDKI